jgi:hypothetical protein
MPLRRKLLKLMDFAKLAHQQILGEGTKVPSLIPQN